MKYAITPKGVGRRPGARCVQDDTPLAPGETFFVSGLTPDLVLAEDEVSLREKTQGELDAEAASVVAVDAEHAAQSVLDADCRADAVFAALAVATPAQIATFVSNRFPAFEPDQRAVIRLLLKVAALTLRRGG